jgi:hypothetical protein
MAARRRGAGPRSALVFLLAGVLLAALLVGVDRVAATITESRVAARLQGDLGTPSAPSVQIEGFPFLTQVARRSLTSVHVVADDVTPPDRQAGALTHVDLMLHDVTSADGFRTSTAGRADGTVTLDYATAKELTGLQLSYAREGRVEVTVDTRLLSMPVKATIIGRPDIDPAEQTLTLGDPEISVAGVDVPDTTARALLDTLLQPVPLTGVPYGLRVSEITAEPDGLVAEVAGQNITFSG